MYLTEWLGTVGVCRVVWCEGVRSFGSVKGGGALNLGCVFGGGTLKEWSRDGGGA